MTMSKDPAKGEGEVSAVKEELGKGKLPFPPEFSGNRRDDKLDVIEWVELVRTHLLLRDFSVNSAAAVQFAKLFLRGPALIWAASAGSKLPKKFNDWSEGLKKAFQPVDRGLLARDALRRLTQVKSVAGYADAFRRQALLVEDMAAEDKVDLFLSNLKPYLRGDVRLQLLGKNKGDLELAITTALLVDSEKRKDFRSRIYGEASPTVAAGSKGAAARSARTANPAASQSKPVKCFHCHQFGHKKSQCPALRKSPGASAEPGRKPTLKTVVGTQELVNS